MITPHLLIFEGGENKEITSRMMKESRKTTLKPMEVTKMKRYLLPLEMSGKASQRAILSTAVMVSVTLNAYGLAAANAQSSNSSQDLRNLLPPEVVPVDPHSASANIGTPGAPSNFGNADSVPGLTSLEGGTNAGGT